ncbi:hypothetical protein V3C99_017299 [Haemonchus contortus]
MLQSVSAHLMDERRQSRLIFDERRGSRRGTVGDALVASHHHTPPQWCGIGVIEDFQPSIPLTLDNTLSWAILSTLPKRGAVLKPRNRCVGTVYRCIL